jgi:hypothetical protein
MFTIWSMYEAEIERGGAWQCRRSGKGRCACLFGYAFHVAPFGSLAHAAKRKGKEENKM